MLWGSKGIHALSQATLLYLTLAYSKLLSLVRLPSILFSLTQPHRRSVRTLDCSKGREGRAGVGKRSRDGQSHADAAREESLTEGSNSSRSQPATPLEEFGESSLIDADST